MVSPNELASSAFSTLPQRVQAAVARVDSMSDQLLDEVIRVATIAAPTFHEEKRSAYVKEQFRNAGLQDVDSDELGNTWGLLPGVDRTRAVLVDAHMDTVFGPDVDVRPRISGGHLNGPGVRDNSAAVAALIHSARLLVQVGFVPPCDIMFDGTVGEEGRGDLRGIRALMARHAASVEQALIVDGYLGYVTHVAVGSRRYLIKFGARGGHSWQAYGAPSAVHVLGATISDIAQLALPTSARTTLNVGVAHGGTNVNVIAESAEMQVDVRSTGPAELAAVAERVQTVAKRRAEEAGATCTIEVIGERPAGSLPVEHPLVQRAQAVLVGLGVTPQLDAGSTNANIPLSLGIPAIAIGASAGRDVHSLREQLDIASLPIGLKQVLAMIGWMAK